jgi:hypothetical protein
MAPAFPTHDAGMWVRDRQSHSLARSKPAAVVDRGGPRVEVFLVDRVTTREGNLASSLRSEGCVHL